MIFIVIPAYNEEKDIFRIAKRAGGYGKVIVVNDFSEDRTAEEAKMAGAFVISHAINKGLGSSIRTGVKTALEMSKSPNDIIIMLDGDGQHDPDDIPKFVSALENGYDFVLGERSKGLYPLRKRLGNFALTIITNIMARTYLKDTESGFRAFRRSALEKMQLQARRYEIAVEIIAEVGKRRIRAANVPIKSPTYVKGVSIIDGLKNFMYLVKVSLGL